MMISQVIQKIHLVTHTSWRYLVRHYIQTILMVVGIALGVAVAVAIDLANASSNRALQLSLDSITGKATHQITQMPSGLPDEAYRNLRFQFPDIPAAPQVNGVITVDQFNHQAVTLLGIDPISEAPFRNYFSLSAGLNTAGMAQFLTTPGAVVLTHTMADQYQVKLGDSLSVDYEGHPASLVVVGIIAPPDDLSKRALDGVLLTDISTAQETLAKVGVLDEIDLILPSDSSTSMDAIRKILPAGSTLAEIAARTAGLNQMTQAFQINLTALSLLALMVGMFLIYNTMTFSVIQRRPLFGTLRSLGVTRREIFTSILIEALLVGLIGAIIGIGVGILLGQTTIRMVSQTVNDLYYTTTVRNVGLPYSSLWKGLILGIVASLLTAIPPAWEASTVPAREALTRITLENRMRRFVIQTNVAGVFAFGLGVWILSLPTSSLYAGFSGLILVVFAFALITGLAMIGILKAINPITTLLGGLPGKLAPRNLIQTLSRTSVAVSALMVAVAVSIGVSLMINSFRSTVQTWLNATLSGDIYVTAPNFKSNQPTAAIDPAVIPILADYPGVTRLDQLKIGYVSSEYGDIQVSATDNLSLPYERIYKNRWLPIDQIWPAMQAGGVMITEPLAFKLGISQPGQSMTLNTNAGPHTFPIVAIYYDYASTAGTVQMALNQYQKYWNDDGISAIGVRIQKGIDPAALSQKLKADLPTRQALVIRPNKVLRDDVMVVFERTFAITRALQILATIVAFVGILNSLSLLQFEKQREVGIIRALGFTPRQLWGLVMAETGLMGLVSGLVAMPAGLALAYILIEVINRRSFGWSLTLSLSAGPFLQALGVALGAALLAGIIPARRLSRMQTIEAIRYE